MRDISDTDGPNRAVGDEPFRTIDGTAAAPSRRMPGGMFHVKHPRTVTTTKTPGSQPPPDGVAPPPEVCRPCPVARSVPGIRAPHPRTLKPSDKPSLPGAGGAHVSRETSPTINLRMCDIPDADGQNQIAGNEPFRSYRRGGGSIFLPDAGGMFHVKRAGTAPTPETPGSQPSPARMAPPLEICRPCPATRSIPGIQAAPIREHSNCPTGLPTRSWRSACFT